MVKLCAEDKLETFYQEVAELMAAYLEKTVDGFSRALLDDAIELNRSLLKQPFQTSDSELNVSHNVWEFYRSILRGETVALEETDRAYRIDRTTESWGSWDDWCRQVMWYGNKRGAYMYECEAVECEAVAS